MIDKRGVIGRTVEVGGYYAEPWVWLALGARDARTYANTAEGRAEWRYDSDRAAALAAIAEARMTAPDMMVVGPLAIKLLRSEARVSQAIVAIRDLAAALNRLADRGVVVSHEVTSLVSLAVEEAL